MHLVASSDYNVLSQSLKVLHFGNDFNQPLYPDSLPESLNELYFGYNFNQLIKSNILPKSLNKLYFGNNSYF